MKKGLAQFSDTEFDAWMEDYFRDKSPQDLHNILIGHEPRLVAYFEANPLLSECAEVSNNSLTAHHLELLLVDRPPGFEINLKDLIEGSSFEPFLFALQRNG